MKSILQKNKKTAGFFLLPLLTLLVSFAVLELGCRLLGIGRVPQEKVVFVGHAYYNPFLIFGPNIDRHFPQTRGGDAYFNAQGFRMDGLLPLEKEPGEYRVFALGGSTTENIPNGNNTHYCGQANALLENVSFAGKKFHCINTAKSGFSSAHSLVRLQFDLLPFKPDMITVMDQFNDLTVNFFPFDGRMNYANKYLNPVYAPPVSDLKFSVLRKSQACAFLYQKWSDLKGLFFYKKIPMEDGSYVVSRMKISASPVTLHSKETFRRNLVSIARIAKANGIKPVFLTQPASFSEAHYALTFTGEIHGLSYPPLEEFEKLFAEYNSVVKEVAQAEQAGLIDMYELLGHEPRYFTDMIHYSAEGIERFAEIYSRELKRLAEAS